MRIFFIILFLYSSFLFSNPDDDDNAKAPPEQFFQLPIGEAFGFDDYDFSQFARVSKKARNLRAIVQKAVDSDGRPLKKKRYTASKLSQDLSLLETASGVVLDREHRYEGLADDVPLTLKGDMIDAEKYKHLHFLETDVKTYKDFRALMGVMHKKAELHVTVSWFFTASDLALFKNDLPSRKRKKDEYVSVLERVFSLGLRCENPEVLKNVIEAMQTFIRKGELSPYCPDLYLSVNDLGEESIDEMLRPFEGRIHVMTSEDIADGVMDDNRNTSPVLHGKRAHEICRLFQDGDKFDDRVGALFFLNDYQPSSLTSAIDLVLDTFPNTTDIITKAKLVRSLAELPERHREKAVEAIVALEEVLTVEECYLLLYAFRYFPAYGLNDVTSDLCSFIKLILFDEKETDFSYEVVRNLDLFWRFQRIDLIRLLIENTKDEEESEARCQAIYYLMLRCANKPKAEWAMLISPTHTD